MVTSLRASRLTKHAFDRTHAPLHSFYTLSSVHESWLLWRLCLHTYIRNIHTGSRPPTNMTSRSTQIRGSQNHRHESCLCLPSLATTHADYLLFIHPRLKYRDPLTNAIISEFMRRSGSSTSRVRSALSFCLFQWTIRRYILYFQLRKIYLRRGRVTSEVSEVEIVAFILKIIYIKKPRVSYKIEEFGRE